ncbi:DUF6801 domain-containing protein [Spirillospora sp. NPDC127200]
MTMLAAAGLALSGAAVAAPPAAAGAPAAAPPARAAKPASLSLKYQCQFPLLGAQPVTVRLATDIPETVDAGKPLPPIVVDTVSEVGAKSVQGLNVVGAATLEGTASAGVTVKSPQGDLSLKIPAVLDRTPLPASGGVEVKARGQAPSIRFNKAGKAQILVNDLVLTLTPRLSDGTLTGLDVFESECVQEPGQDNELAEIIIGGGGPVGGRYAYDVTGTTTVKAGGGTAPLTGGLDATTDEVGAFTGPLKLAPTKGDFKLFGFLPVQAGLALEPQQPLSGSVNSGSLKLEPVPVSAKVSSFTLFGIPLGGGDTCRTEKPSQVGLAPDGAFDPAKGGTLKGGYELAPLAGCGVLNGLVSSAFAGPGNTIALQLAPKPATGQ